MSFKLAAAELNVTRGAISRQIKALEEEAGTALFSRETDGIVLTTEGEELYSVLARGFSEASEAMHRIRTGNKSASVTLASSNAFATFWLMPRMGAFWRTFPDVKVDHLISDNAQEFRNAKIDLRIRYGFGAWPDEHTELLFHEKVFPVCGPGYDGALDEEARADIGAVELLHVDGVDPEWTNWDEFLRRAGVQHGPLLGRRFNNFTVLMQAAQDDQGVALGWQRLLAPLIEQKKLKRFGELEIEAPGSYYVTWNRSHNLSDAAVTLKDWLVETAHR